MKRVWLPLALVALSAFLALSPASAQTSSITGHNETSENSLPGGSATTSASPGTIAAEPVVPAVIDWMPVMGPTGERNIRFKVRWMNPDPSAPSAPFSGSMNSQEFGVFLPDYGPIGSFNVPPIAPNSFFDVFFEVPLSSLPPAPQKIIPGMGQGSPSEIASAAAYGTARATIDCPPDTNWAGNVDIIWSGPGQGGQVNKHYADLMTCIGGAPSYIHFRGSNCPAPMPWSVVGVCPGYTVTLVNEDFTPAPNPVPVGWSGWICVSAAATVPSGTSCCFGVVFQCQGSTSTIEICSTACECQPHSPTLTQIDWTTLGTTVRFHQRWENPSASGTSDPVSGNMSSQPFGVFLPNFGPIGSFNVPPIAPNSFFDVFFDVAISDLPPPPQKIGPGGGLTSPSRIVPALQNGATRATFDCPPDNNWAGNVDIFWTGPGGNGQVNRHYADLLTCAGGAPSYIHFSGSNCPVPMPWTVTGLCPGYSATLVNEDFTPAPNPVPVGWSGWICVTAAATVPSGTSCCFGIVFECEGVTSTVEICSIACDCGIRPPTLTQVDWTTTGTTVRFHQRWENPSASGTSDPVSGNMNSQPFGVFRPNFGPIGSFNVPPMAPNSFFDVFFDVAISDLPPQPRKIGPGSGPGSPSKIVPALQNGAARATIDCPPDINWAGNVDIVWTGQGGNGQVNRHYADLLTCAGGAPSYIHFSGSNCPVPMPWRVTGLCPGYSATLVNEDFTPAPNPVPVGWSGWICVTAAATVPSGTSCCFGIVFECQGSTSTVEICSIACDCGIRPPTLTQIDWTTIGTDVRFHQRWENPSSSGPSDPVSGNMNSQKLGVFLPDFGPIGSFNVPPIAPSSFFDVFFDVPLSQLPPEPELRLPGSQPGVPNPCVTDHWHGNVNITWNGAGGVGQTFKHFGEMPVCPGAAPTYLFIETDCLSAVGAPWTITGLCPGFSATLVNTDLTPAPNPVPAGWIGMVCVSATAATPLGTTCCFKINFLCNGAPGVIDVCANTCYWGPRKPVLAVTDWRNIGSSVRFHMRWTNPNEGGDSEPVSGNMMSQPFGAFAPDFGPIGQFNVPPIPPASFFDVFFDVPMSQLPPQPQKILPGAGPEPGNPTGGGTPPSTDCPPDTSWSGNVDIMWSGASGGGQVNRHFTGLLVRPGTGSSHVHTLVFCNSPAGATWSIAGLCPGFTAALLNEDFTPAPNPVPPGWTGWISVAAAGTVPAGVSCCFTVTFLCDGVPGVIDVCAETCLWSVTGVPLNTANVDFGIYATAPNPTNADMMIGFAMPKSGVARLDIYNLSGQRVRTLLDGPAAAGPNTVRWDGRGEGGRVLAPGAYFIRLKLDERVASKMVVLYR